MQGLNVFAAVEKKPFKWSLSRESSYGAYGALVILHAEAFTCRGGTRTRRIRRQQSNFVSDDPIEEAPPTTFIESLSRAPDKCHQFSSLINSFREAISHVPSNPEFRKQACPAKFDLSDLSDNGHMILPLLAF